MDELYQTVPEQVEPIKATLQGSLPDWLKGSLLRNGPAMYEIGEEKYRHWFDGLAMLHNYTISHGEVFYCSRYLQSQAHNQAVARKSIVYAEFGTPVPQDPCKNIFNRFFSYFVPPERTDNCSVGVFLKGGSAYANSDSPFLVQFDPSSLQALSTYNARKDFPGPIRMFSMTPHPHEDKDGTVYNVAVSLKNGTKYNILAIPSKPTPPPGFPSSTDPLEGVQTISSFVPHNRLSYYHSFAMTPNFFVFVENPFVVNVWALLTMKMKGRSFHECMKWDNSQPSRFYLIDRKTGKCIAKYKAENFFAFHHVNAYELENEVIVDICCYPDARIVYQYYLRHLRTKPENEVSKGFPDPALRRYRIPVPTNPVIRKSFQTLPRYSDNRDYKVLYYGLELPQINYNLANGRDYRFVYGVGPHRRGDFLNQLVKVDVLAKEAKFWFEENCYPSEPVFVAAPGAEKEDRGVVMASVVGLRGKKSFLLVLDAETFQELARATVDCRVAHSLHGVFRPVTPGQYKRAWVEC